MHIVGGTIEGMNAVRKLTPIHATVSSVATNTETQVVAYTVPAGKAFYVQSILGSGNVGGKFKFYINAVEKMIGESSVYNKESKNIFGGNVGIECVAGDILSLTVTHQEAAVQNFEGSIIGFLDNV
ncbi:MAG: hypothetical protein WC208_10580 [Gallionella sp.]|jgi:hypothetical protein